MIVMSLYEMRCRFLNLHPPLQTSNSIGKLQKFHENCYLFCYAQAQLDRHTLKYGPAPYILIMPRNFRIFYVVFWILKSVHCSFLSIIFFLFFLLHFTFLQVFCLVLLISLFLNLLIAFSIYDFPFIICLCDLQFE